MKTIKLLEENMGGLVNEFLDVIPKAQETKAKIDQLDYIKIRNLCVSRVTTK